VPAARLPPVHHRRPRHRQDGHTRGDGHRRRRARRSARPLDRWIQSPRRCSLPEARHTWIDAASSLERQQFTLFEHLGRKDTAAAFHIPIRDAGYSIAPGVLDQLVSSSRGFPYVIQLIGAETWEATTGSEIDEPAVRTGVARAVAILQDQVFVARWRQMAPGVRDSLAAAAELEDPTTEIVASADVAARLGLTTKQLSMRRELLITTHQVLASPARGQLVFTQTGMADWIRAQRHRYTPIDPESTSAERILDEWRTQRGAPQLPTARPSIEPD
jgi:hypothetical protein